LQVVQRFEDLLVGSASEPTLQLICSWRSTLDIRRACNHDIAIPPEAGILL